MRWVERLWFPTHVVRCAAAMDGAPSFVPMLALLNAGPSALHPSDEDLSLGNPIRLPHRRLCRRWGPKRAPLRMTRVERLWFPTHVAMKLRHGWGTLVRADACFAQCGSFGSLRCASAAQDDTSVESGFRHDSSPQRRGPVAGDPDRRAPSRARLAVIDGLMAAVGDTNAVLQLPTYGVERCPMSSICGFSRL